MTKAIILKILFNKTKVMIKSLLILENHLNYVEVLNNFLICFNQLKVLLKANWWDLAVKEVFHKHLLLDWLRAKENNLKIPTNYLMIMPKLIDLWLILMIKPSKNYIKINTYKLKIKNSIEYMIWLKVLKIEYQILIKCLFNKKRISKSFKNNFNKSSINHKMKTVVRL